MMYLIFCAPCASIFNTRVDRDDTNSWSDETWPDCAAESKYRLLKSVSLTGGHQLRRCSERKELHQLSSPYLVHRVASASPLPRAKGFPAVKLARGVTLGMSMSKVGTAGGKGTISAAIILHISCLNLSKREIRCQCYRSHFSRDELVK